MFVAIASMVTGPGSSNDSASSRSKKKSVKPDFQNLICAFRDREIRLCTNDLNDSAVFPIWEHGNVLSSFDAF